MSEADARSTYERGRDTHVRVAAALESRERALGAARLGVAAAAIALIAGILWSRFGMWGWDTLGALAVAFVALVVVHSHAEKAKNAALAAARFHERGLARLALAWDDLPAGTERFRSPNHPYTGDLDIFGHASLMQLVDATETRFGEERLAALLSLEGPVGWPNDTFARGQAARELAPRVAFREALATAAGVLSGEKPDPSALVGWAESTDGPIHPAFAWLAWAIPAALGTVLVAGAAAHVPSSTLTAIAIAEIALALAIGARVGPMLAAVSARESSATRWRATMAAVERERFDAPLLVSLRADLTRDGRSATVEMAALERIVAFLDARNNEVFRFVIGPLLMWDVHCAFALLKWRARTGRRLGRWLEVIGHAEALSSLAAFAFEHPGFAWPEPSAATLLEASGLAHPLIPADRRVGNDVHLPEAGRALVVTGSNMSGKSTLLRAIGVNAVLAFAGAPVCARSMRIGPVRVTTSMRVQDSLSQGVSHFYAEILRLKRIVDWAGQRDSGAVLFLLDEILHGTNSRERVRGASAVVCDLLAQGAMGVVSTHDLGITALERDLPGRVENVHFEEQVDGTEMAFDYTLRPGVVHSSNALRLMRAVGIPVDDALLREDRPGTPRGGSDEP
jgi:hypothetical protein